jgi:hypothetical protein
MTYQTRSGRQFVLVATGRIGATLVAFALGDGASDQDFAQVDVGGEDPGARILGDRNGSVPIRRRM